MTNTIYCDKCDEFVEYNIKEKNEKYNIKNEEINIKAKVAYCKKCNTELFHEKLDKINQQNVFNNYRKKHNLLSTEKIKNIRKKYNLNQKEMSQLLGWGEITYHRYEKGALPDSAHNNQLLLIEDPNNVKKLLKEGNTKLNQKTKQKLKKIISNLINKENIVEIKLPKKFYNQLNSEAKNNNMELDEYIQWVITSSYYKKINKRKIK